VVLRRIDKCVQRRCFSTCLNCIISLTIWVDELGIDWVEIGYKEELYEDEEPEDIPILMMSGAFEIAHWGL
jgi:hypothetical protein